MDLVLYEVEDRIGYITLNRPDKRNALSGEMVGALMSALIRAEGDSSVKVIVLRANGEAFCAGADLAYLQKLQVNTFEENLEDSLTLKNLFLKIYTCEKVVIAQVQGHALAGGCGIATVCDFAFSSEQAKFGYTEVKIGFIPALVSVFLIRKIGEQKARQLLLTGDIINAQAALSLGIINNVYSAVNLPIEVRKFAQHISQSNSAQSMQLTKKMISEVQSLSLEDALQYAANMNAKARATEDCKAGIAAFLNKQGLKW
jgi:methylglutaconyl-CoA hydratase